MVLAYFHIFWGAIYLYFYYHHALALTREMDMVTYKGMGIGSPVSVLCLMGGCLHHVMWASSLLTAI